MNKLTVIKIGGKVIDDVNQLTGVLQAIANWPGKKILIHGGGSKASEMEKEMGLTPKMINGRRVTSKASLDVVTMVYAGLINKNIVAKLQAFGVNAIGLTGADANIIKTKRRNPNPIDFGFVGDVENIDALMIDKLLTTGLMPVVSAITHDGKGQLLNTNADTMAGEIAIAMAKLYAVELIMAFEKSGVLDGSGKIIDEIDKASFKKLTEEHVIVDGMIPKLTNAFAACDNGVDIVKLTSSEYLISPEHTPFTKILK